MWLVQALVLTAGVIVLILALWIGGLIGAHSRRFSVRLTGVGMMAVSAFVVPKAYRRLMTALPQPVPMWVINTVVIATVIAAGAVSMYLIISNGAKRLARRIPGEEGSRLS